MICKHFKYSHFVVLALEVKSNVLLLVSELQICHPLLFVSKIKHLGPGMFFGCSLCSRHSSVSQTHLYKTKMSLLLV